jgi:uncharacterized protein YdhG (YjbR/CyaY superfamily)
MKIEASHPDEYIQKLPEDRQEPLQKLRAVISDNLPEGFDERMSYGMIGYVVPHSLYPDGYHAAPELPLPFINLASQKNHIAIYHSGIYADDELMDWFTSEYPKHVKTKLNIGKSCIRFKNPDHIPYELIGELARKMTPEEWISLYEKNIKR